MSWFGATVIETAGGMLFDFEDPAPECVQLDDIAHALGNECRFGGHTSRFYSVAEHSVLVSRICVRLCPDLALTKDYAVAGLMHDAHEAYLGDVPKPLKNVIEGRYDELCDLADAAICDRFGLDVEMLHSDVVKQADILALMHEAHEMMPSKGPDGPMPGLPSGLRVPRSADPKQLFLERADVLGVEEAEAWTVAS